MKDIDRLILAPDSIHLVTYDCRRLALWNLETQSRMWQVNSDSHGYSAAIGFSFDCQFILSADGADQDGEHFGPYICHNECVLVRGARIK